MSLFLQPDVCLQIRHDGVELYRKDVPVFHTLGIGEAFALSWLAASGDYETAAEACAECLPDGEEFVKRVVDRYWTYLGDGPARPIDLAWLEQATKTRPKFAILPMSNVKQEAAPACITWLVTLGCNRKCPYCFFNVYHFAADSPVGPPDATFPLKDAVSMVHQMAQIGAADLYLTGGEPFLRQDLSEVIEEATRARVRTHAVTKYLVSPSLAKRIATAGITSVTVSIDDSRPKEAAALAGSPGYLAEATQTVRNLLEAGVNTDVNTVATKVNINQLDQLALFLADLNVKHLKISPFHSPYPIRLSAEKLVTTVRLEDQIADLQLKYQGRGLEIEMGGEQDPMSNVRCGSKIVCEIGTRALDVLPDGSASRCHYLPGVSELTVGSLRTQTILEIWNGPHLRALSKPERESFAGTACEPCDNHQACNSRGRCYVSALQSTGQLHAPDAFCTREAV